MSLYLEFRCEHSGSPTADAADTSCHEPGLMALAGHSHQGVVDALLDLESSARAAGWSKLGKGWICGSCAGLTETTSGTWIIATPVFNAPPAGSAQ